LVLNEESNNLDFRQAAEKAGQDAVRPFDKLEARSELVEGPWFDKLTTNGFSTSSLRTAC